MDRSIGTLRQGLRDMQIAENTLVWFNSDNGGLPRVTPETVGGLRGFKGTVYEGGLRVPCVIEWPAVIKQVRVTHYPAATMDIFPTIAEILDLPPSDQLQPVDGVSIRALFEREIGPRQTPLGFRHTKRAAFIDNNYKLVTKNVGQEQYELYNLAEDEQETNDLFNKEPKIAQRMTEQFRVWNASVSASFAGQDYPEGCVSPDHPPSRDWRNAEEYRPYFDAWKKRPEYQEGLRDK